MAKTKHTARAKVLDDGTLMLYGVVGDEYDGLTASQVVQELRGLGDVGEINVILNSPGGMVTEGLAIYNELVTNPATVNIEITGLAASMGSVIAMAGDRITIAENAMMMVHNPWNVAIGDADDLRKAAEVLDKFGTSLVGIYAQRTGLDEDEIRQMMDEETWLDANEALEKGFVDAIGQPVEASALAESGIDDDRLTKALGIHAVPAALTRLMREGRNMEQPQELNTEPQPEPVIEGEPSPEPVTAATVDAAVARAVTARDEAEVARCKGIRALAEQTKLGAEWALEHIEARTSLDAARAKAIDALADAQDAQGGPSPIPGGAVINVDERDKFISGASAWLIQKAGHTRTIEAHTGDKVDAGEFRGMSLMDLARNSIERAGGSHRGLSKMDVAGLALGRSGPMGSAGLGTRSDFPVLLENALHKMLMAAYATTPDTWRAFCAEGSVSDFREHKRLRLGSLSVLDALNEAGEFTQKHLPDAEKEGISASTKGNVMGLTRQAIVNDDVNGFSRAITMLGRAAARSIEVDVYATLALNAGLGPVMGDGDTLFHANHGNITTGAALTSAAIDLDRVGMAQQQDPDGNDYLDLRPDVLVVPIGLGSTARTINEAQYDPDATGALKPNVTNGLFSTIVDTPRISGTRRYLFANPSIAPVIEVVFLDGQSSPVIETEEGFDYDGVRWRVRFDYGVGATDYRGAITNAGA